MIKKTIAAGLLALATVATSMPANAQNFTLEFNAGGSRHGYEDGHRWRDHRGPAFHRTLSPQEVRRVLRGKGFRNINYVDRRGSIYQVRATAPRGQRVGLVVNARNGAILNRYRL